MYEYNHHGCGCGDTGAYEEDTRALERLAARAARDAAESASDEERCEHRHTNHDCGCGNVRERCEERERGERRCGCGNRHSRQSGICRFVNCVRRSICGCGCTQRRHRND